MEGIFNNKGRKTKIVRLCFYILKVLFSCSGLIFHKFQWNDWVDTPHGIDSVDWHASYRVSNHLSQNKLDCHMQEGMIESLTNDSIDSIILRK